LLFFLADEHSGNVSMAASAYFSLDINPMYLWKAGSIEVLNATHREPANRPLRGASGASHPSAAEQGHEAGYAQRDTCGQMDTGWLFHILNEENRSANEPWPDMISSSVIALSIGIIGERQG